MSKKINFSPINASDAKDVHDLQKKLFPPELTESLEEITTILSNADQLFNCNHSFAVYDNLEMIGYVFAYVDSKSIFHGREEEIFYCKELGLLPGYEKNLRLVIFKLTQIWLTYAPQLPAEAHAVEEAKNKWMRLPKLLQQFEIKIEARKGGRQGDEKNESDPDYFLLRWEAGLSEGAPRTYSLPNRGWQYQPGIVVNVISDASRLEALRKDWDNLLINTAGCSFLSSLSFVQAWWKYFGPWQELYVVVIRRNDEIIGIAPLMKECWDREGVFEQELSIIAEPSFKVVPQLLFAKNEALCFTAMMAFLSEKENASTWQKLSLEKQQSATLPAQLSASLTGSPYSFSLVPSVNKRLQLGNSFQHFVERQLLAKSNYNSLLELQEDYEYVAHSKIGSSQQVMDSLSALEEDVTEDKGHVNHSDNYYFFYSALVELLARENKLRWSVYRKDNKLAVSNLGFVESNIFYLLMQTHQDERPQEIDDSLLLSVVKTLIVEGVTQVDFVGEDLYESNSSLLGEDRPLASITISLKGSLIERLTCKLKNIIS